MHMALSGACVILLNPVATAAKQPSGGSSTTTKVAETSMGKGKDVSFRLVEYKDGIWFFDASCPKMHDPYYGGDADAIPSCLEVVCVEKDLALLHLRTAHRGVPTDYYVYNIAEDTLLAEILGIQPEIFSSSSVGLLCKILDDDGSSQYIVANLRLELDEKAKTDEQMEAHLDSFIWKQDSKDEKQKLRQFKDKTKWTQNKVDLDFTRGEKITEEKKKHEFMCEWTADQVVSLENYLLWVDVSQGILLISYSDLLLNDLRPNDKRPELKYVPLPHDLLRPERPVEDDAHHSRERPERFRSVAGCEGNLNLVNLYSSADGKSLDVEIWKLGTGDWTWSKKGTYNYSNLWESIKVKFEDSLPQWQPPCFPVLSTHNSSILYLTFSAENKAFLVRISMKEGNKTVRITEYPPLCGHNNLLRPVGLSNGNTDPTDVWEEISSRKKSHARNNIVFTGLMKALLPKCVVQQLTAQAR